jgi:hypothetical protein
VIDRLVSTLRALATLPVAALASAGSVRLRGDCADALRLELDCPQQALTPAQRAALSGLSDLLEGSEGAPEEVRVAAERACVALGLAAAEHSERTP